MIPKLRYENDIGSVMFNEGIPGAYIEKVTSYGAQNVEFQATKSNREIGETLQHQNVGPKTMTIKGTIVGESEAIKAQMLHVLAPLAKGRLIYYDGEKELELETYVKVSADIDRDSFGAKFSFSLYAPYPYWRKHERESQTLTGLTPKFKFPWNICRATLPDWGRRLPLVRPVSISRSWAGITSLPSRSLIAAARRSGVLTRSTPTSRPSSPRWKRLVWNARLLTRRRKSTGWSLPSRCAAWCATP